MINYICKLVYFIVYKWHSRDLFNTRDAVLARALMCNRKCKDYMNGYTYGSELWYKYESEHIVRMLQFYNTSSLTKYEQGLVDGLNLSLSRLLEIEAINKQGTHQ